MRCSCFVQPVTRTAVLVAYKAIHHVIVRQGLRGLGQNMTAKEAGHSGYQYAGFVKDI